MPVTRQIDGPPPPWTLYETLYGRGPSFDGLLPFGTDGYVSISIPTRKITWRGSECIPPGRSSYRPRSTFRVRDLATGSTLLRHPVTWHHTGKAGGGRIRPREARGVFKDRLCSMRLVTGTR